MVIPAAGGTEAGTDEAEQALEVELPIFLSFFAFACASRGFFPTHFSVCFPPTLQLKDVIQAIC